MREKRKYNQHIQDAIYDSFNPLAYSSNAHVER